ncbi:hypothetical protein BVIET440_30404 [Burkholderia vietnamiensis]|nr:hypothetical protein AK36_4718 [Burkholderia vietnamiensis LMG 10929]CAG9222286.1 conserved hypothetical protein [Burkholderia vietnamiensis]
MLMPRKAPRLKMSAQTQSISGETSIKYRVSLLLHGNSRFDAKYVHTLDCDLQGLLAQNCEVSWNPNVTRAVGKPEGL